MHSGDADIAHRLSPSPGMAHSTNMSVPAVDLGEELVANMAVGVDRRARQLRTMLRAVAITHGPSGSAWPPSGTPDWWRT